MLGRTANDLFWLSRYVERAENMARLIEAGYRIALQPRIGDDQDSEWISTLESTGCTDAYKAKHGEITTRNVIDFLLFDASNPSSIHTCLASARRNARTQRTALTREMWESLNGSWLEFQAIRPDTLRPDALPRILDWIKERSAGYRGALMNTILRNDTYYFSQLGTFGDRSSSLFNLTLIIAGVLVTTFALYLQRDLQVLVDRGVLVKKSAPRTVSIVFAVMGVMLACVGVFPLTVSVLLHNLSAMGMAVAFLALLFASPWILTGLPRRFFVVCAGFAVALIGGALLFEPVQYYNLTAFELVAFAIIFAWIAIFIRFISALADEEVPT